MDEEGRSSGRQPPPVAVPKPKPEGDERLKVGGGNERLSCTKVGEEPVPAMLKGWTLESSDKRLRGKQEKASRKLGGQGKGEPPRSRRTEGEASGEGVMKREGCRAEREEMMEAERRGRYRGELMVVGEPESTETGRGDRRRGL